MIEYIAIILPVLTFIAGILLAPYVEKYKAKHKLKRLEEYVWDILRLINEQMKLQADQNYDCLQRVKDFKARDFTLTIISGKAIQNYHKINHSDIYKIIVKRKKDNYYQSLENFKQINKAVDYFDEILPSIIRHNEILIREINKQQKIWNKGVKALISYINQCNLNISKAGKNPSDDTFMRALNNLLQDFENNYGADFNMQNAYYNLIIPIIQSCKSIDIDDRAKDLLPIAEDCKKAFIENQNVRDDFRINLITSIRNMLKMTRLLEQTIKKYAP